MTLYDSDHKVVGTPQVTGSSGTYQFANLAPGVYSIQVTPPSGMQTTRRLSAAN